MAMYKRRAAFVRNRLLNATNLDKFGHRDDDFHDYDDVCYSPEKHPRRRPPLLDSSSAKIDHFQELVGID